MNRKLDKAEKECQAERDEKVGSIGFTRLDPRLQTHELS